MIGSLTTRWRRLTRVGSEMLTRNTEEMLTRTGLYPDNSAPQGQVLRLSRYRAAHIGVDVNLHTGRWTFEQAVRYFMEGGGQSQKISAVAAARITRRACLCVHSKKKRELACADLHWLV